MPLDELLALYGYESPDPISEQESEGSDTAPALPDMTLDKVSGRDQDGGTTQSAQPWATLPWVGLTPVLVWVMDAIRGTVSGNGAGAPEGRRSLHLGPPQMVALAGRLCPLHPGRPGPLSWC